MQMPMPISSSSRPGAILPDGRLNASLLRREIADGVRNDARCRAENDMKKRAIHASKDYDEFRKFVSASQLKPVGRKDVADLFSSAGGRGGSGGGIGTNRAPRNKSFRNGSSNGNAGSAGSAVAREVGKASGRRRRRTEKEGRKADASKSAGGGKNAAKTDPGCRSRRPTTSSSTPSSSSTSSSRASFEREWRRNECSASPSAALRILRSLIPEDAPSTLFRVEIDADVLGGAIGALGYLVDPERCAVGGGDDDSCDGEHWREGGGEDAAEVRGPRLSRGSELAECTSTSTSNNGEGEGEGEGEAGQDEPDAMTAALGDAKEEETEELATATATTATARFAFRWMDALARCERFDIAAAFLEEGRRTEAATVLDFLEANAYYDDDKRVVRKRDSDVDDDDDADADVDVDTADPGAKEEEEEDAALARVVQKGVKKGSFARTDVERLRKAYLPR